MSDEVSDARTTGIPVEGFCLYPILDHRDGTMSGIAIMEYFAKSSPADRA